MSKKNPFIAGSWVRGKHFFGRRQFIAELLESPRQSIWVAATRRFGKTSLLKQIEYLTEFGDYADRHIALFWDLQGSRDAAGLKESLLESLEDVEEKFATIGIVVEDLEDEELFPILRTLRKKAREHKLKLVLLCDEAEELITVERNNPEILPKLRRFFQRGENIHTILTATKRLGKLIESRIPETSPFLHGFLPPAYLPPLRDEDVRQLTRLGDFDARVSDEISKKSNNHPYLVQLICKRFFESGNLQQVMEEIGQDELIGHFFSVDFQTLAEEEREILLLLLNRQPLTLFDLQKHCRRSAEQLTHQLYELSQLGFIKYVTGHYAISNYFFEKWLHREKEKLFTQTAILRVQSGRGGTTAERLPPGSGDRLSQHLLQEELGSGGMGIVYKARDLELNRDVAIKILQPEMMNEPDFRKRFVEEARAASLMNHPNIATIYQIGEEDGVTFISMEYVDGHDLLRWRQAHADELALQLDIAVQAARGLVHAHEKNIVHRDIKPENIMVTRENVVKIMDFGLAKQLKKSQDRLTKTGTTLGTLRYMSPEQAGGLSTDFRSDIFSFAVVLFELFTGELPFSGEFELSILYAIMNEKPRQLREVDPRLPEELQEILDKALEKERKQRYQSMAEVLSALQALTSQ